MMTLMVMERRKNAKDIGLPPLLHMTLAVWCMRTATAMSSITTIPVGTCGVRPVVCLKSDVKLVKSSVTLEKDDIEAECYELTN